MAKFLANTNLGVNDTIDKCEGNSSKRNTWGKPYFNVGANPTIAMGVDIT
jgi:hypothetical protein